MSRRLIARATTSRGARSASGCSSAMNATPCVVAQDRALAAQRLREQRARHRRVVQRGGVELHELEVGDRDAGPQRHRDAVAGGERRVGGDREALPGAAGRDHACARRATVRGTPSASTRDDADGAPVLDEEVGGEPALADLGAGLPATAATSARSISAPVASPPACTTRATEWPPSRAERELAAPSTWSKCAPSAMSSRTRVGALAREHPHRVGVAEARRRR